LAESTQQRVILGVCGGVAAYKAAELVRTLQQHGLDIQVVMTHAAQEFVRPLTFSSLTGHRVITSLWNEDESAPPATGLDDESQIEHIAVAQSAAAVVIAPATAHVLAKMTHGLADDFLSTMLLATTAPVVVAPAMNVNMWNHPATQANLATLRSRGIIIVEPDSGYLACGMTGSGRLAEISTIAEAVVSAIANAPSPALQDLVGETFLITAGGTREAIDPVRFLGNRSSGKMGYALAEAARSRGAQVVLVSAPTALTPPAGCAFVPVTTAEEMHAAVMEHAAKATVVIGAAAVADFRTASIAPAKLRREGRLQLDLEPTEDIMRAVADLRDRTVVRAVDQGGKPTHESQLAPLIIAFAAEMESDIPRARAKLLAKRADAIVLNDISQPGIGFDSDTNAATFVTADEAVAFPAMPKRVLADSILNKISGLRQAKSLAAINMVE
jgi:phosphopantothenoylcysteine decarboxylase/phosphopantothenate--cysteine ligase